MIPVPSGGGQALKSCIVAEDEQVPSPVRHYGRQSTITPDGVAEGDVIELTVPAT